MIVCANCRQVIRSRPHVNLNENVIVWQGDAVHVFRRGAEICWAILETPGAFLTTNAIIDAVYSDRESVDRSNVRVQVLYLRKKLQALGIDIVGKQNGYAIEW